jgi:hypothetical protein
VLCQTFKENPYFSPSKLWKQVKFSEDEEEVEVTASELTWKDKAEMTEESEKFPFLQVCLRPAGWWAGLVSNSNT